MLSEKQTMRYNAGSLQLVTVPESPKTPSSPSTRPSVSSPLRRSSGNTHNIHNFQPGVTTKVNILHIFGRPKLRPRSTLIIHHSLLFASMPPLTSWVSSLVRNHPLRPVLAPKTSSYPFALSTPLLSKVLPSQSRVPINAPFPLLLPRHPTTPTANRRRM